MMSRRLTIGIMVATFIFRAPALADEPGDVKLFPLGAVELLDGPFKQAQDVNRRYILQHDADRLLAPFRKEAGLEPRAEVYPNWEATGLGGHVGGHYLTALAQLAAMGDEECERRLDYMVSELAECQRANGDGYVGGVPNSRALWQEIAASDLRAQAFSLNDRWVPWYNLHKLFAGLRDAWLVAGNEQARDVLIALTDWCDRLVADLSDEQMQDMLRSEHGGMNEVLADVAAITGDDKYLALARRFSHRAILDPLLGREDRLTGLHANTQIPKVAGYARIAQLEGDAAWLDAARFFWETVTRNRSVAIGGNSVREHFHPPDDFSSMIESEQGPETCNTYNMLRLTELLFRTKPAARYADYYERALFNHILASQHPSHGGLVYFTPMRPRHYRVYSQPEQCFWCCVGSGIENHGKYGQFIYAADDAGLYVNLFIISELDWAERGVHVRQWTRFPDEPGTSLTVSLDEPAEFALRIRHPGWVARGALRVRVNEEDWLVESEPASYVTIERRWEDGDRVDVELPMQTKLERLPDGSDYVAVLHGPIVLAAETGTDQLDGLVADDARFAHIAGGPQLPLDEAPTLVGDERSIVAGIETLLGDRLRFVVPKGARPAEFRDLQLIPFFRVHDARYVVYWRLDPAGE